MNRCFFQRGFFLLEVLITMMVMAIGLLGISAMLMLAHKASSSSYLKQKAVQSTYNIIDRIRANRQAAMNGSYTVSNLVSSGSPSYPSAPSADCGSVTCTDSQLATYDIWYWLVRDIGLLPKGSGSINTSVSGGNTIVTITVQWDDSPAQFMLGAIGAVSSSNANIAQLSVGTSL